MHSTGQVVILLGPPGSGKGTQGALLASRIAVPEISTGAILRRECESGTRLGKRMQSLLTAGKLVSDELVNQVVANRLRLPDCRNGFILDGYPRTVAQARFLDDLFGRLNFLPPMVLDFHLDSEEIVTRLSRRYNCALCGRSYSIINDSNPAALLCEGDGSLLFRRSDDNPAAIRQRLRLYAANGAEVITYYRQQHAYHAISASRHPAEIAEHVNSIIDRVLTPPPRNKPERIAALA